MKNLKELEELLKKTFDLKRLLINQELLTDFTIFIFDFNRNKSVGCRIENSQIRARKPEDTGRYIAHLVVDELFKSKGE